MAVTARYRRTGTTHAVHATGGPGDGSLYGFATYCSLVIDNTKAWDELPGERPRGKTCAKALQTEERFEAGFDPWCSQVFRLARERDLLTLRSEYTRHYRKGLTPLEAVEFGPGKPPHI